MKACTFVILLFISCSTSKNNPYKKVKIENDGVKLTLDIPKEYTLSFYGGRNFSWYYNSWGVNRNAFSLLIEDSIRESPLKTLDISIYSPRRCSENINANLTRGLMVYLNKICKKNASLYQMKLFDKDKTKAIILEFSYTYSAEFIAYKMIFISSIWFNQNEHLSLEYTYLGDKKNLEKHQNYANHIIRSLKVLHRSSQSPK